jgi:pilus assembly protein Flp/PilA
MSSATPNFSDRSADGTQTADTQVFSTLGGVVRPGRGVDRGRMAGPPPARSSKELRMLKFCVFLHSFLTQPLRRDDRGVTSVEYGLLVALVGVGIIVAAGFLATRISGLFNSVGNTMQPAPAP